jgi:hypothetical protein
MQDTEGLVADVARMFASGTTLAGSVREKTASHLNHLYRIDGQCWPCIMPPLGDVALGPVSIEPSS